MLRFVRKYGGELSSRKVWLVLPSAGVDTHLQSAQIFYFFFRLLVYTVFCRKDECPAIDVNNLV